MVRNGINRSGAPKSSPKPSQSAKNTSSAATTAKMNGDINPEYEIKPSQPFGSLLAKWKDPSPEDSEYQTPPPQVEQYTTNSRHSVSPYTTNTQCFYPRF